MATDFPDSDLAARIRLMTGTLSWLAASCPAFEPPQEDAILDIAPEAIQPGAARKAYGELGLALRLCHRVPVLRDCAEIRMLTAHWLAWADERHIFFDARRRVHLVPLMAVALTVQADLGRRDEQAAAALQAVLNRAFFDRVERSAWGQADIAHYLDALGLRHSLPDPQTLLRRSSLLAPPVLPHASRLDLYAVTHLVFHLTDFGACPLSGATIEEVAALGDYLALALATFVAEQDWDLVGELAAARACLALALAPIDRFAVRALAEAQQPPGFMPDRSWLQGLKPTGDQAADRAAEFAAVYHPTLVMLIMLACEAARDHAHAAAVASLG